MIGVVTVDTDSLPDRPDPGQELKATFTLVDDRWFDAQRGTPPDEQASIDGAYGTAGRGRVAYTPATTIPTAEHAAPTSTEPPAAT